MSRTYNHNVSKLMGFLVQNNAQQQRLIAEDIKRRKARDQEKRDAAKRQRAVQLAEGDA
jgi:hypothetical protein